MKKLTVVFMVLFLVLTLIGRALASDQPDWGVRRIRADLVWNMNTGVEVRIAIIDSGVWKYHTDLEDRVLIPGITFHPGEPWDDVENHGTLVAGIIAATINNYGLVGVSPNVSLLVVRILPISNLQDIQNLVDSLYWAADQDAQIIIMSFTLNLNYTNVWNACNDLYYNRNILLIGISGNNGGNVSYPAAYDSVIAVGAVNETGARAPWSNYGLELELVAPGVNINSTADPYYYPYQLFMTDNGTSWAAPHVAGVAALIYASKIDPDFNEDEDPWWDNTEVRMKLRQLALDLGPPGRDDEYGYGMINAWATNQRPLGDITSDYMVDGDDLIIAYRAFGSYPGHPYWDPRADINIDNTVDGNDIIIIDRNFGKSDP